MLDRYHIGRHTRQSPEADVPLIEQLSIDDRLGGAGNVACNLKSLELNPILLSVIGDDAEGRVIEDLCKEKFETYHLITLKDRPSTLKSRIVDQDFKQYLRLDREVTADIDPQDQEIIAHKISKVISQHTFDAIVIQDYNKGMLTSRIISLIQKTSRDMGISLIVDPKKKYFSLLSNCTVFKPNLKELSQAAGYRIAPNVDDITLTIKELGLDKAQVIMVTMAEHGIFYLDQKTGKKGIVPGHKIEEPDVSGAGDTVLSTLVKTLIDGIPIERMAEIANLAGAIVCKKRGIEVVNQNELNT